MKPLSQSAQRINPTARTTSLASMAISILICFVITSLAEAGSQSQNARSAEHRDESGPRDLVEGYSAGDQDELANVLAGARSEEERAALLAEAKDLLTPELVRALKSLGDRYSDSDFPKAMEIYRTGEIVAERIGDASGKALCLGSVGAMYRMLGDYVQAWKLNEQAMAIKQSLGDKPGIAQSLMAFGVLSMSLGNLDQAIQYYQKSLALSESLADKRWVAPTFHGIAQIYQAQGNYARALEYYQKGLALREASGDKAEVARVLTSIATVHYLQGGFSQALKYSTRALASSQALDDKIGMSQALTVIGAVHRSQDDYAEALECFHKSLALREQLKEQRGIGNQLNNIGFVYYLKGDYTSALTFCERALAVAEASSDKLSTARSLNSLALVHKDQGNYTRSLQFAERAIAIAKEIGANETVWSSLLIAGSDYRAVGQNEPARRAFEDAIAVIESLRTQVAGGEQQRERSFENKVSAYRAMVELLVAQNSTAEAFAYAELSKARVLLDVLASGRVNVTKAMNAEEEKRERDLTANLVSINSQIYREQARPHPDENRLTDLKAQLSGARLEHESFESTLYAAHPELRVKRGETKPLKLEEAASLVSHSKTALLEYVVTADTIYLFALTKSDRADSSSVDLTVHTIGIREKDLAHQVEQFRQTLANQNYAFQKPALDLYRLLLQPVATQLKGQTSVVIVPDGVLWNLPFQTLQNAEGHFVIEDFSISYVPSLTVLHEMQLIRRTEDKGAARTALLAVGNPSLGAQTLNRARSVLMDQQFEPLPETERQVRKLGELYGPSRSRVYVGAQAREDVIKAESQKYKILQLATHGVLNDVSPMYSYVLLSRAENSTTEDGFLEAWEIMDLNLNADLVVLSACETARGKIGAGEGVIGLSWAVFVAGCPTSVVSQWKVESASTTELMLDFHRNLTAAAGRADGNRRTGPDDSTPPPAKAEALRRAQLTLLHSKNYSHPFYWAAFVLMGDGGRM